jgi:hypothetical protein
LAACEKCSQQVEAPGGIAGLPSLVFLIL